MRPFLSYALVVSLSFLTFGTVAQAHEPDEPRAEPATAPVEAASTESGSARLASYRVRVVGEWEEFTPSRNYVDIFDDGRIVLYLKKGEVGDLKTLDGTWTVKDENRLHVQFMVNGNAIEQIATLSFERDEMLLTSEDGAVTRHRKRNGALPEEYRW